MFPPSWRIAVCPGAVAIQAAITPDAAVLLFARMLIGLAIGADSAIAAASSPSRRQEPARAHARPYLMAIARPMPVSAPVTRTTGDRLIDLAFRRHWYLLGGDDALQAAVHLQGGAIDVASRRGLGEDD